MSFEPQEALARMRRCIAEHRVAHAYLIVGNVSLTETGVVRPWLRDLLGREPEGHPDIYRVAPLSKLRQIKIEQIRQLLASLYQTSRLGGWKVAIIAEADRLLPQAANAFLKTLEEPARRTVILLLTSAPDMLLPTIRSRCLAIRIRHGEDRQPPEALRPALDLLRTADRTDPIAGYRCLNLLAGFLAEARDRLDRGTKEHVRQARGDGIEGDALDELEKELSAHAQTDYLRERRDALAFVAAALGSDRHAALAIEEASHHLSRPIQESLVLERLFLKLFALSPPPSAA